MLEGKTVNLRIVEKEDLPLLTEWLNNPEFSGEFMWFPQQQSRAEREKEYDNLPPDTKQFFIEKKDGTKIGWMGHFLLGSLLEIFYYLLPSERGKGYGTEAAIIMVDYLFLSKDLERIQAKADPENIASCKALEKAGFKREGILRKTFFCRGKWKDDCMFSILREEWKEPKILTRTT
ncbi:GNAT family N-acetyltransferase [Candidatus Bathyarchaeota archaeon]|nr:GNAT family N-acetyltransferase [Candidatus Bathyarchaeota archaeon]